VSKISRTLNDNEKIIKTTGKDSQGHKVTLNKDDRILNTSHKGSETSAIIDQRINKLKEEREKLNKESNRLKHMDASATVDSDTKANNHQQIDANEMQKNALSTQVEQLQKRLDQLEKGTTPTQSTAATTSVNSHPQSSNQHVTGQNINPHQDHAVQLKHADEKLMHLHESNANLQKILDSTLNNPTAHKTALEEMEKNITQIDLLNKDKLNVNKTRADNKGGANINQNYNLQQQQQQSYDPNTNNTPGNTNVVGGALNANNNGTPTPRNTESTQTVKAASTSTSSTATSTTPTYTPREQWEVEITKNRNKLTKAWADKKQDNSEYSDFKQNWMKANPDPIYSPTTGPTQ